MNCQHTNPAGYVYCGICGIALNPVRCRCGFVAGADAVFCGRCGINLAEVIAGDDRAAPDYRFDLERMAELAAQEKQFLESTDKARVTQDDIRKLLSTRRKKF